MCIKCERELTIGDPPPKLTICIHRNHRNDSYMGGGNWLEKPDRMEKRNHPLTISLTKKSERSSFEFQSDNG